MDRVLVYIFYIFVDFKKSSEKFYLGLVEGAQLVHHRNRYTYRSNKKLARKMLLQGATKGVRSDKSFKYFTDGKFAKIFIKCARKYLQI